MDRISEPQRVVYPVRKFSVISCEPMEFLSLQKFKDKNTIFEKKKRGGRTWSKNKDLGQKSRSFLLCSCIIVSLCGLLFGWDIGTIGGLINFPQFKKTFSNLDTLKTGLIISIFNVGCCIGGLGVSNLSSVYGRKMCIIVNCSLYLIGIFLETLNFYPLEYKWIQFLMGRIFIGASIGSNCVVAPMFIEEIAPRDVKGSMITLHQLTCTMGILFGNVFNYYCKNYILTQNRFQWTLPISMGVVYSVLIIIGIACIVPESPVFLEQQQNRFYQTGLEISTRKAWKEAFVGKPLLGLRLLTGCLIMVFQQFSGINYFFYYSTVIFGQVGKDPYLISIVLSLVNFLSSLIGMLIIDRFERKKILLSGSVGCFVTMFAYATIGTFFVTGKGASTENSGNNQMAILLLIMTCFFIICFAITLGPISFVIVSELFPNRVKTVSMGISSSSNWVGGFIITLMTPILSKTIEFKLGYLFASITFVSVLFNHFVVPETKNKSSDQINNFYYSWQKVSKT